MHVNKRKSYAVDITALSQETWSAHDRHTDAFRLLIVSLLNRQAEQAVSQSYIAESSSYSKETIAGRLLEFAVAFSEGDPNRIDKLRDTVELSFTIVERQWGGKLPEIGHKTREAVTEGLDQWQNKGKSSAIELLK